jgi:hypothetical protein
MSIRTERLAEVTAELQESTNRRIKRKEL